MTEAGRDGSGFTEPRVACPNCGDGRSGRFCATCGQNDRNYVRGLLPVLWELVREAFEVDSRILQTLKLLLFKPGSLSSEFSGNRRARYMSPVRLYLFSSFLFFLVLATVPDWTAETGDNLVIELQSGEELNEVGEALHEVLAEGGENVPSEAHFDALRAVVRPQQRQKVDDLLNRPVTSWSRGGLYMLARLAGGDDRESAVAGDLPAPDAPGPAVDSVSGPTETTGGPGSTNIFVRSFFSAMVEFFHDHTRFLQRFVGNLPIAMFFLLPCLASALAICYRKNGRYFVEHLVFGMHVQTFSFVVLTVALVVPFASVGTWVQLVLQLLLPVYGLVALRRFYGDGWFRTIVKGWIVWWMYWIVLVPGLLVTFFLTA